MTNREYDAGDLVVSWDSSACQHSANCIRAQPGVFRPRDRPWINVEGADPGAIAAAIDTCPSGALSYRWRDSAGDPAGQS